jgi:GT2 family glycosyltransferase
MTIGPPDVVSKVSAILPTFNRSSALRENLPIFLDLESLGELIVVDDCSSDETEAYLASVANPLLRVIRHPRNLGSPGARATGIAAARFPWILMLEDDCRVPVNYGTVLLEVALQTQAAIVGAPWIHASSERLSAEIEQRRIHAADHIGLDTHPGTFPTVDVETPFMPALVLAKRELFQTVNYDSRYGGNAWREETSLFISAVEAGHRCVLTPRTFSYQVQQWAGGQERSRLSYEAWVVRNNWRFLRRHEAFLRAQGHLHSVLRAQLRFVARRFALLTEGKLASFRKASS